MHIKRIHEMVEELTECTLSAIKANESRVGDFAIPDVIDMIKDLCCAEKDAREAKEKEKEEEDEKKENEYFLKMLKEEYGEEEGEKRFYSGQPRSRTSGRFMSRGDGRRRGYEEPPYLHMPVDYRMDMEDYTAYPPEYWRDMDRKGMNRLYYTDGGSGGSYEGSSGGNSGQSGNMGGSGMSGGNSGGNVRGYSDGYNDGYSEGERNGRKQGGNSRYERAKRGYEEVKESHKGNTPEDKQLTMREAEKVLNVVFDEIDEMLDGTTPEMKNMVKTKTMSRMQKIQ